MNYLIETSFLGALTSEMYFFPPQQLHENLYRARWTEMKQIPLSVPIHLGKQNVKKNDKLLNALPKEGWPSLKSPWTTLKYGPQLNFLLCIWLLIHHIRKHIQDRQALPSPGNSGTKKPGKTESVTEIFAVLHIISQLRGSRYFSKGDKHTSDVA